MADQDILTIVRFDNRKLATLTESNIRIMFDEYPFDMNLIAANDKKIPVHIFVMMMFSPYIRLKLKDKLPDQSGTEVHLTDFSYEVLCDVVKYIYYGEVAVRNEIKVQFSQALKKLNIVGPLCNLEDSEESDDGSDGEGYKELVRDNDANLFDCEQKIRRRHKRPEGKMPYKCFTLGCKVKFFTKVIDGKTMIKVVHAIHSQKCDEQRKQWTTPQNEWSDLLGDMVRTNRDTPEKLIAEKSAKASGIILLKKPHKKAAKKGTKRSNTSDAAAKDKE